MSNEKSIKISDNDYKKIRNEAKKTKRTIKVVISIMVELLEASHE